MATVPSNRTHSTTFSKPARLPVGYPAGIPRHVEYPNFAAWGLLARAARLVPHRIAAEMLGTEFTYARVDDAAKCLAAWLQRQGIGAGKRVGVLLPNCPEYLVALNAIWRAGGVAVALSPLSVRANVSDLLRFLDCRTVISLDLLSGLIDESEVEQTLLVSLRRYLPGWKQAAYLATLWQRTGNLRLPSGKNRVWLWDAIAHSNNEMRPVETLPASDPAYILSTGGTTGHPKAVTLSHRNIVANAWQQTVWAGASMGKEKMLAVLPFFHSYGMSTMLASGCGLGATLIMKPRFVASQALRAIAEHRPTVFHAVPAMLNAMNMELHAKAFNLSSLKWVISGGAALPETVAEEFAAYSGALVVEGYGLSEASPVTHVGPLDGTHVSGTIGLPLPDTECRIVDIETGTREVAPGEVGELLVRGPQVMLGYFPDPAATERTIRQGWLHTGDLAQHTPEGFYRIVDRKKDLIITSGFNVYPADVEHVLRQCDVIRDVAVIGVPDASAGELVKAFVVLQPGCSLDLTRLNRYCKQHLAAHLRPRLWEQVQGDLPRNFLGKVVRRELRALDPAIPQACRRTSERHSGNES